MIVERTRLVQATLLGGCALVALILLVSFYSVVHGAVDRAARHRVASSQTVEKRALTVAQRAGAKAGALVAQVDN
jgi:hypothetical protein